MFKSICSVALAAVCRAAHAAGGKAVSLAAFLALGALQRRDEKKP